VEPEETEQADSPLEARLEKPWLNPITNAKKRFDA